MLNKWLPINRASAVVPPFLTAGDGRNPILPDPPDLAQYPPLSPSILSSSKTSTKPITSISPKNPSKCYTAPDPQAAISTDVEMTTSDSTTQILGSVPPNSPDLRSGSGNFTVLKPKNSSPLQTNRASSSRTPVPPSNRNPPPSSQITTVRQNPNSAPPALPTPPPSNPPLVTPTTDASATVSPSAVPSATNDASPLIDIIRKAEDKTLSRLAPISYADNGRPRVLIPDEVFQKGADLHKDFIVCYFKGRPPPYSQIQSVLNHMWGKGRRLEIHNNPLNRSVLVRITSDYLKAKILEKNIWYVGDSMFHTAQWNSVHSAQSPSLESIQIWAHLTGVPLDLRHTDGLSWVAGLVGEPKETDDFTKNLVSLTLSHVKVEVDLTKPLPDVVEFTRQSGEVVEVLVTYPWLPPTCAHCKELGHIAKNCLLLPPPPKEPALSRKGNNKEPNTSKNRDMGKDKSFASSSSGEASKELPPQTVVSPDATLEQHSSAPMDVSMPPPTIPSNPSSSPPPEASNLPPQTPLAPSKDQTTIPSPSTAALTPLHSSSGFTSDIFQKPALKRSRSNPTINSPPSLFSHPPLDLPRPLTIQSIKISNSFATLGSDLPLPLQGEVPPSL